MGHYQWTQKWSILQELQRADNYMKKRKQRVAITKETGEGTAWQQESIFWRVLFNIFIKDFGIKIGTCFWNLIMTNTGIYHQYREGVEYERESCMTSSIQGI